MKDKLYETPKNLVRKLRGLHDCIKILENLYPPIFCDDPMISGHLKRLKADYQAVMDELKKYPNAAEIAFDVWKEEWLC